ncbi:DUF2550 domain-containing protein [Sphaerisporangium sp. TRM90804]|uniref:DUF2550 domain-containing protein n=1 Tax=Sphaerisporangium sp. TRM90804 TaxID=3031113 RepID=UPI00244A739E|nr:DUF2550 domain-containing protein [Sphaerisporangium sp. TRM90804]MDH2429977.1 DUF2550 domain-containing protein [Sphaerisporangium sp. TRM90804]
MAALDLLLGVAAIVVLLALRGLMLARARGNVICSIRTESRGWRSGVARYAGGELHWIPFLGLRLRPRHAIARRGLIVSMRRPLKGEEGPKGYWTVDCAGVSLAMSEDALTGFLAWVESAPPSAHLDAA